MPLPIVPRRRGHTRPPTRAIEKLHKKFGGDTHPHVSHSWTPKAKTKTKRVWVARHMTRSGLIVKGHFRTVKDWS